MRVGIVGLGYAGSDLHLPALAAMPDVTLAGGCDLDAGRRERAAARFGLPVYPSVEALLGEGGPEVVVVATPPAHHAPACRAALDAGAHVICEKPFAVSVREADELIAAARAAERTIALNHEFREMDIFRAVLDAVARGEAGRLAVVQVWQLMDLPGWKEKGWRQGMGRGILYEAGIHLLDLVLALYGEKPAAVSATMSGGGERAEASDAVALVTMEFADGRIGHVMQHRLCRGETQYAEVRADGDRASLRASFGGRMRISAGLHRSTRPHLRFEIGRSGIAWREVGHRRTLLARNPADPARTATGRLLARTLAALGSGEPVPVPADAGRDVLEVLAACYRAAETGTRVRLGSGGAVDPALAERRLAEVG